MTKKKRQRKERARQERAREHDRQQKLRAVKEEPEELDAPGLPLDPRAMERMTARIGRIMGEQQFESSEEVQAFMSQYLSEGGSSLEAAPTPTCCWLKRPPKTPKRPGSSTRRAPEPESGLLAKRLSQRMRAISGAF